MILPCASLLYFIHILYTASRSGHARFGSYATFYSSGILSLISCFFIIYHPWCEKLNINPALSTNKKILNGSIMTLHLGSMMVFLYYTIPTSNSPDSSALKLLVIGMYPVDLERMIFLTKQSKIVYMLRADSRILGDHDRSK